MNYEVLAISEVIYAFRTGHPSNQWQLFDLYKVASDFPMNLSPFGSVNGTNLQLYMRPTTGSRRKDLQGLRVPCAVVVSSDRGVMLSVDSMIS